MLSWTGFRDFNSEFRSGIHLVYIQVVKEGRKQARKQAGKHAWKQASKQARKEGRHLGRLITHTVQEGRKGVSKLDIKQSSHQAIK